MHNGNVASPDDTASPYLCPFCLSYGDVTRYTLKETESFRLVTDYAPVIEGHLLIIPKQHYACYGAVPASLDAELSALKQEVQAFLTRYYAPTVFWEHGVFRQTVFHAHLHCFPVGETYYDATQRLHERMIHSQQDIRNWYHEHGHYFFLQDSAHRYLFAPHMEAYRQIMQNVLWAGVARRYHLTDTGRKPWRSPQQRQEEGLPLIAATRAKWCQFQEEQEGQHEQYINETSA